MIDQEWHEITWQDVAKVNGIPYEKFQVVTVTHRECGHSIMIGAILADKYQTDGVGNSSRSMYCQHCKDEFHPTAFRWSRPHHPSQGCAS
jgi:hypothetical protein